MSRRGREIETLVLTMIAAVPLYFTHVVAVPPLIAFHLVMTGIALNVAAGRGPELVPAGVMRALAVAYVPFYILDALMISRSAIAASTHLVLFIAAYQPIESMRSHNQAQRLLTTALIFTASLATSTDISILPFVVFFGFVMYRQLMYVSHLETLRMTGGDYSLAPPSRSAFFYVAGTAAIGVMLFPLIPRLKNPLMPGVAGALGNTATGLSDSIDFNRSRTSTPDAAVVARVWMGPEALPFFTPLRLRGAVYDAYSNNEWRQTRSDLREVRPKRGAFRIAKPVGFTRGASVQQRMVRNSRLFLPAGTYAVTGLPQMFEGGTNGAYMTLISREQLVSYEVSMARVLEPIRPEVPQPPQYPVTAPISALARQIVGGETNPARQAELVERYLLRNFRYVQNPEQIGRRTMTTDEFLLRYRKGHCEYFAAGMVALMTALNVPSRIVGGFYGGRMNPLTGYLVIRREDAHAWVEVWDAGHWVTYDPTPASMRPGNAQSGLLNAYASALSDSVNFLWDRYVLTYGLADQIALAAAAIDAARNSLSSLKQKTAAGLREVATLRYLTTAGLLIVVGAALVLFVRRRRPIYELLSEQLRQAGVEVSDSMTVEEALRRLRETNPAAADTLAPLVAMYEAEQFSGRRDAARQRELRRALIALAR